MERLSTPHDDPPMADAPEAKLCTLQYAQGRVETCPEAACPFWEVFRNASGGACAFERVDFEIAQRPDVARLLLELRTSLDAPRADPGERRLFHRLRSGGRSRAA